MFEPLHAVYRDGAFYPSEPCLLPNDSHVTLIVQPTNVTPPTVTDPQERTRLMNELIEEWQRRVMPPDAPRFTRDELHERS